MRVVFSSMPTRTLQLVLHYDGTGFSGWQATASSANRARRARGRAGSAVRRPSGGADQDAPMQESMRATGGWRARAGEVDTRNAAPSPDAILPHDMWVAAAHAMRDDFHARYSATSRRYGYYVGTDEGPRRPFGVGSRWAFRSQSSDSCSATPQRSSPASIASGHSQFQGTAPAER
jgi:hypothetical protein